MKGTKGLHERLTEIAQEITGTNLESQFDGKWFLTIQDRKLVRSIAARLVVLVDEYDKLDPLHEIARKGEKL